MNCEPFSIALRPPRGDVVVSVGDMIGKGPAEDRCLELWRERG